MYSCAVNSTFIRVERFVRLSNLSPGDELGGEVWSWIKWLVVVAPGFNGLRWVLTYWLKVQKSQTTTPGMVLKPCKRMGETIKRCRISEPSTAFCDVHLPETFVRFSRVTRKYFFRSKTARSGQGFSPSCWKPKDVFRHLKVTKGQ